MHRTGASTDDGATPTHCPYCAFQCGMRLSGGPDVQIAPDKHWPVNRGRLCTKGWTTAELLTHHDRILHPLVRDAAGRLRRASWDAALDEFAEGLDRTRRRHGADAVGVFGSGALTNEKAYLLGKFARVALRTATIDDNGRFCMSSAAAAQNRAFGLDRGLPFPVSDIAEADTVVLWGANSAETMPPIMQWFEAQRERGGTLVVVDPRRTDTARAAQLHLQPAPGTDLALALGMLHLAVVEELVDEAYVAARTVGFDAVRRSVLGWTPDRVERVAGVPERALRAAVELLAGPPRTMLLTGRGPEQQSKGVDTVLACCNLMLALGRVGKPASGYGCLTGQGNGQGGREHGQKADQLPGYRSIADAADRAVVAACWGIDPTALPGPGPSAQALLGSMGTEGGARALLVVGSNVAVAAADSSRIVDGLRRLDCLGVLDAFENETSRHADVVLPVTQWAEEDGTTTNLEGRVVRRCRAVAPPGEVRSDLDALCALAERLGAGAQFTSADPATVFAELAGVSAGGRADYSGISYDRLDREPGVFWPCPAADHPGTPRLFAERFGHADGRARMVPVQYRAAGEEPDETYPVLLTTGRYREHYNSGTETRRVARLAGHRPEPCLEVHPMLAAELGVGSGDLVLVESRRGKIAMPVAVDPDIRPDTVFAPFHWGGRDAANVLTGAVLDPTSGMPEFKVGAVRIRACSGAAR